MTRRLDPAYACAAALGVMVLALLGPAWAKGLTPFWSDLTYLHQAWRSAPAMSVAAGRVPLWEPSLYLGMPSLAALQGALLYPPTILYYLFGFATATALYHALHLVVAGWLCALWLRSWRMTWGAALGGGILFAFGGLLVARLPYLNHLSVFAWAPALLLFFRRPAALGLVLALMTLAGYPTAVPGCALAAWAVAFAARTRRTEWRSSALAWGLAGALAAALSAAQLLPGLELASLSRRAAGLSLEEALTWSFSPGDLLQWIGPLAVGWGAFKPAEQWWLCVYLGVAGTILCCAGALAVPRRRAAALAVFLAAAVALTLGGTNPLSSWLWAHLAPLKYVRYPGNLAYLCLPALAALAAAGLARRKSGPVLVLLLAAELAALGRFATPLAPRALFTDAGPLVRALQERQAGSRYLISPRALHSSSGADVFDWRRRLYGLTNAPYRLRAAVNFGEPLVPRDSYAAVDFLQSLPGADAAASWMPWIGASRLLTPSPADTARLAVEGVALWHVARVRGPVSLAYFLPPREGAALPAALAGEPPETGSPLELRREREDRFEISGEGAGWAFAAEPRFPGWTASLETPAGVRPVSPLPALGPFQKVETPAGPWTVRWRYEPRPWALGLLASWASLAALAAYWYHRR